MNNPAVSITTTSQVLNLLNTIINWAFTFFFAVAVFFFLWSAFEYLTSGGDEEKTKKAKSRLLYGVLAVAVALIARSIPFLVQNFISGY
jgi:hypothetical protein